MSNDNKDFNLLIEQCKNGNQHAFEEIYQRCNGYVAFVCSKFFDDKEDIDEIVQDTFLHIFDKVDELRGETLVTLLRKVAIDKCNNEHRSRRRHMMSLISRGKIYSQKSYYSRYMFLRKLVRIVLLEQGLRTKKCACVKL